MDAAAHPGALKTFEMWSSYSTGGATAGGELGFILRPVLYT